ncbi:hypothetical protein NG701_09805 [Pseudarthrobacter sp. HLT3-5]|uniref:hypothetical protein n=1 Tax=Pseudarthrobacter cellobiosi TaxID=2953654 RepID=UPI00208E415C|nr:hypothetical protein [Pseudarthrobacter sp. HLT3-5]MCO4274722.1 hypothetical protein [Pseudarthrobacter sp. HLT3-5]
MNSTLSPTATAPASAAPVAVHGPVPQAPSIHVRAVITWLAIFPLVAVGMLLVAPLTEGWHSALRSLVLTLVVVPVAVYLVVPRLFAGYGALLRRRNSRKTS